MIFSQIQGQYVAFGLVAGLVVRAKLTNGRIFHS